MADVGEVRAYCDLRNRRGYGVVTAVGVPGRTGDANFTRSGVQMAAHTGHWVGETVLLHDARIKGLWENVEDRWIADHGEQIETEQRRAEAALIATETARSTLEALTRRLADTDELQRNDRALTVDRDTFATRLSWRVVLRGEALLAQLPAALIASEKATAAAKRSLRWTMSSAGNDRLALAVDTAGTAEAVAATIADLAAGFDEVHADPSEQRTAVAADDTALAQVLAGRL